MTPVPSLFRIVTNGTIGGLVAVKNAYHVFADGAVPSAFSVATDFDVNVWPIIRVNLGTHYTLGTISVQRMLPDTGDADSALANETGTINLGAGTNTLRIFAPAVLAGVITWRTRFPGRSGRGRSYIGGLICSSSDGAKWHTEQITSLTNIANAITDHYALGGNTHGLRLCVFSRKAGGRVPPYNPSGIQEVLTYTVQPMYCTMGSRRLGHGV